MVNKRYIYLFIYFVCLVPVHPLPSSMAVLYYVNDQLQRLKEAIVTFIIRTPPQSVITASVLSSSDGMYLSYVEAPLCLREVGEREKRKYVYAGEDGKGKLLFVEARGAEQSRQQQKLSSDSHLRDTLSSVLDPGSQSCSLLVGHNQETNKKHIHEYVTIMYFPIISAGSMGNEVWLL